MNKIKILWADDEIDLLKPHINFLEQKGYSLSSANSGTDALEELKDNVFDLIFLDEQMPGLSGLETLNEIRNQQITTPVIMVTKTEDEYVMDDAIGSQIADYLIKPVNPKQLLLSIKKVIDKKRLVSDKVTSMYQRNFGELSMTIHDHLNTDEWIELYKKLVHWELALEKSDDNSLREILISQKSEANSAFFKFVKQNYKNWIQNPDIAPLQSNKILVKKVLPLVEQKKPVIFVLIDNFRYDQWKAIQPLLTEHYNVINDDIYYSIIPTATNYARNTIFSGLMPQDIYEGYPDKWVFDEEKGSKNKFEEFFLKDFIKRLHLDISVNYQKITSLDYGKRLPARIRNSMDADLSVIVYNFIDLLSHVRTEMEMLKELAEDETAYRSLTLSWFKHSPLFEALKIASEQDCYLVLTTDHGSIRVQNPSKVIGDKNTTSNLRFKQGKNLNFNTSDVLYMKEPAEFKLPQPGMSSSYIFAKEDSYFIYPNNYNYFVNFFDNTFQHGGISLEEMLIPLVVLESK